VAALTDRLAVIGAQLLVDTLATGSTSFPAARPQHGDVTYAGEVKARRAPPRLGSTGSDLERVVRLDRAWTTFRHERLLVLDAVARSSPTAPSGLERGAGPGGLLGTSVHTGDGVLELLEVQPAGKRPMGPQRGAEASGGGGRQARDDDPRH